MPFYKKNKTSLPRSRRLERLAYKDGLRHMIFNTVGDKYKGEWKINDKAGKGILFAIKGELYEGDFKRSYRDGFGVWAYKLPDINVYTLAYRGDWKDGHMEGYGLRVYKDGSYYLGDWKRSKRHGHGQMWYADKSFYDGDWVKDVRQGLGLFVRADGNRYEGAWYNDMKHGKGRFFFLVSGQIQEGIWIEDFCTYSIMYDVPFRQTAIDPSAYPIPINCVIDVDEICQTQEWRALSGLSEPCLSTDADSEPSPSLYS